MTTLILIYLGVALVGSGLPFIRVYLAHFHNLVHLVISACLEGSKIHLNRDGSAKTTGNHTSPLKKRSFRMQAIRVLRWQQLDCFI